MEGKMEIKARIKVELEKHISDLFVRINKSNRSIYLEFWISKEGKSGTN